MTEYDNTNTGALFKNDKGDNEKRPDYKGNLNVAGVEYWISAWLRTSKKGAKFMSLKVEPSGREKAAEKPAAAEFVDDEIPF